MDHQAARPKGKQAPGDEPVTQPMRATRQGEVRRNPSTDQKKVRRANQRKVAERAAGYSLCKNCGHSGYPALGAKGTAACTQCGSDSIAVAPVPEQRPKVQSSKTADWTPGHVSCSSCGHVGHPVLGDATAPNCANCGSYSISSTKPHQPEMSEPGAHVDNRTQKRPVTVATRKQAGRSGTCAYCEGESDNLKYVKGQGSLCPDCQPDESIWDETGKRKAGDGHPDWKPYESSKQASRMQCENCGSSNVISKGVPPFRGSGPGGRGRFGDVGYGESIECKDCGTQRFESSGSGGGTGYEHRPGTKDSSRKTATVLNTDAWRLNPGDNIRMPNGRTMKVHRVRPHETSGKHVYVDTDSGTSLAERAQAFEVVHSNAQQQSLPGYGTPGGNSNKLPFDPQSSHGTNVADTGGSTGASCPACKRKGTLQRQGDHYTCSACGYRESFGGAGGHAFSDAPRRVQTSRRYSTINTSGMSAIARRAREVLAQEENS